MKTSPVYGGKCGELLANFDHESSSWKMLEMCFEWGDQTWSDHLPKSGMIVNGQLYRLTGKGKPSVGQRERWFCVAYSNVSRFKKQYESIMLDSTSGFGSGDRQNGGIQSRDNYWNRTPNPSPFCRVDDGISNRVARLKALGNAIVPQCSQWVGDQVLKSGLLDDLLEVK